MLDCRLNNAIVISISSSNLRARCNISLIILKSGDNSCTDNRKSFFSINNIYRKIIFYCIKHTHTKKSCIKVIKTSIDCQYWKSKCT